MNMDNLYENVKEYWNAWELRTMILLSLLLQFLLVIFGNRRKYMAGRLLGLFVWLAYLSADWIATFSLGALARNQGTVLAPSQGDEGKNSTNPKFIPLFWAPALLVHLGGPDAITAFAMEDNQLWIRRLLEAITQVVIVIYALIKLWSKDNLPFVAIPIFFVGLYKYGERIWVLWLASSEKFRASTAHEIGDHSEGYEIREAIRNSVSEAKFLYEAQFLYEAHVLFQMFKGLLSNLLLLGADVICSRYIISLHAAEIFKLIEAELGFAYDVLYTKITGVYSGRIVLRSISFLLTISALVVFSTTTNKLHFSRIDIFISYVLLVGAIVLEIYSIMAFLLSDWTMLWIGMQNVACAKCVLRAIWSSRLRSFFNGGDKRWSGLMAQHDLLKASQLRENSWDKFLEALADKGASNQGWQEVSVGLKQLIFDRLLPRSGTNTIRSGDSLRTALEERGGEVLRRKKCFGNFGWSVVDLEFHQSLLVWHIATSICYWIEFHENRERGGELDPRCRMSQSLSNYMMYLVVKRPLLLPKGISEPRFRDTKLEMIKYIGPQLKPTIDLSDRTSWDSVYESIESHFSFQGLHEPILEEDAVRRIKESTSARHGGQELARLLHEKNFGSSGEKWEMISEVWVDMLIYAAGQCEWKEHAQALTRGGELITLVSLLMAHLGLTLQRADETFHLSSQDELDQMVTRRLETEAVQWPVDTDDRREAETRHVVDMAEETDGVGSSSSGSV